MLSLIYPFSFLASLTGLVLWFFFRENPHWSRRMSQLFLGGFLLYTITLAFAEASLSYKILILIRDLVALAGITIVFSLFRRLRFIFLGLMAALYLAFPFFIFPRMMATFPEDQFNLSNYDKKGEILIEMAEGHQLQELGELLSAYQLDSRPAWAPEDAASTDLDDYFLLDVPNNFEKNSLKF